VTHRNELASEIPIPTEHLIQNGLHLTFTFTLPPFNLISPSDMDPSSNHDLPNVSKMKDFYPYASIFPERRAGWMFGSLAAGMAHIEREMWSGENVGSPFQ
jgi:hypothetical protein